jgi:hypothetical protein
VSKEKLHSPQVLCPSIDQGRVRPSHRMCPVACLDQSELATRGRRLDRRSVPASLPEHAR